jgi:hypothetical protein
MQAKTLVAKRPSETYTDWHASCPKWLPVIQRDTIRDQVNGFAGQFIENAATIQWSASTEEGFAFESDENTLSYALIGKERNSVFFPHESETQTRRGDP